MKLKNKKVIENDSISYWDITTPKNHNYVLENGAVVHNCGVGFSVERQEIQKLPTIPEELYPTDTTIIVKDSKLGWVQGLNELISLLYSGRIPKWDLSLVRPAGSRLKTFGGRACLTKDTIITGDSKCYTINELFEKKLRPKLWSFKEHTGEFILNELLDVVENGKRYVYEIKTKQGNRIRATDNHRFMNKYKTYQFLSCFSVGDKIAIRVNDVFALDTIISIDYMGTEQVFDLVMKGPHYNFVANGFISHNSGPEPIAILFQQIVNTFKKAVGRKLNSLECHAIVTDISAAVLCGGVRRCCFSDTEVLLADNTWKKISELNVGDSLFWFGEENLVMAVSDEGIQETKEIVLENETSQICTNEHRWFVFNHDIEEFDVVNTENLKYGNYSLCSLKKRQKVAFVRDYKKVSVFDIEVSHDSHLFIVRSINGAISISHNSALISLSNLSDDRMRAAKTGRWWDESPNFSYANNSVAYTEKPEIGIFMKEWLSLYLSKSGERGIFNRDGAKKHIKNLGVRDFTPDFGLNPCVVGDTLVAVADGREYVSIRQLAEEGRNVLVYCLNDEGQLAISKMVNPRITGVNVPVYEVMFEGGHTCRVTENHKFLVKEKGYVEAKNLNKNDSFLVIYNDELNVNNAQKYEKEKTTENKICEFSKQEFVSAIEEEMILPEFALKYKEKRKEIEFYMSNHFSGHSYKVISVKYVGVDTVYNGTVEQYHNYFMGAWEEDVRYFMGDWKEETRGKKGKRLISLNNLQCGEILLRDKGLCNLSTTILRPEDTKETLKQKIRLSTILGTLQSTLTNFRFLSKDWKRNAEEERLLGVSISGIMDNEFFSGRGDKEELKSCLKELREYISEVNQEFAEKLGINTSVSWSAIKPEGNSSQLVNCSSGIHPRHSQYYIRRVQGDATDPLVTMLKEMNVPCEPLKTAPATTVVFSFPMKSPNHSIFRHDMSAIEQLELYKIYKENYTTHNPSITVYVKEEEWMKVGAWVYENFDQLIGLTFLPLSDHIYTQAPYEEITEAQYLELMEKMPTEYNWERLSLYEKEDNTTGAKELACVSGVCEI